MFNHKKYMAVMITCFLLGGFNLIVSFIFINVGVVYSLPGNSTVFGVLDSLVPNATYIIISSVSTICLLSSAAFILAGVSIYYLTADREKKLVSASITNQLLTSDEQNIINCLKEKRGSMTQKELLLSTQLSKAKISRLLNKLASKSLISKYAYGMTNKVLLK